MVVERPVDLNDQVLGVIKNEILEGKLPPRMRLHVGQLAERFGVSPTPVKNALGRLATEGLVEFGERGGAFVSQLTERDIEEIIEIRAMIETFAAQRAILTGTDADWDHLETVTEALRREILPDGSIRVAGFSANDLAFHRYLIALSGNERLAVLYESQHVYTMVARAHYRLLDDPGDYKPQEGGSMHVYHEHLAIVRALRARDLEGVESAIKHHLDMVLRFARSAAPAGAANGRAGKKRERVSLFDR